MSWKREVDTMGLAILCFMYVFVSTAVGTAVHLNIADSYETKVTMLRSQIENRNETIQELEKYKDTNSQYAELIQQITETLVENDSEYGLGGVDEDTIIYSDEKLLEAILSDLHTRSPQKWVNNVGVFYNNREETLSALPDMWPVVESEFDRITSSFGLRYSPIDERMHHHEGIDITTDSYSGAVLATAPGKVVGVWNHHPRYGRIVYIEHAKGFSTRYAHLSRISVRYGETVDKGQVIGYIGNSGISDGAHLHYEIRKNDEPIDPIEFMLIK